MTRRWKKQTVEYGGPLHRLAKPKRRFRGGVVLTENHPAVRRSRTLFPNTVVDVADSPRLLIDGVNSRKIGARVVKGRWKGFPIFTLTLEERATCPRSCSTWNACYGNNMPRARRHVLDRPMMEALEQELRAKARRHPGGFVVRPHVLGDFGSPDDQDLALGYVGLWRRMLDALPSLHVFGYTAHDPETVIGGAILSMTMAFGERCWIRFSGRDCGGLGALVIERPEDSRHVICPAQTGGTDCCGTCGLCWTMDRPIEFLRH